MSKWELSDVSNWELRDELKEQLRDDSKGELRGVSKGELRDVSKGELMSQKKTLETSLRRVRRCPIAKSKLRQTRVNPSQKKIDTHESKRVNFWKIDTPFLQSREAGQVLKMF